MRFLIIIAVLAASVSAESLMVTVEQNSGAISIRHAEIVTVSPSQQIGEGRYILAYETDSEVVTITAFDLPFYTMGGAVTPLSRSQQTIVVPTLPEAKSISVYNISGDMLATFSLSGISKVGDARGTPPDGSIAAQTGQTSIAKAVANSTGGTTQTTTTSTQTTTADTQSGTDTTSAKGGLCLITYMVPALGAAAAYRKYKR